MNRPQLLGLLSAAVFGLVLGGSCGSNTGPSKGQSGASDGALERSAFEGIYKVTKHQTNAGGCAESGLTEPSAEEKFGFFFVYSKSTTPSTTWSFLNSCADLEACRKDAKTARTKSSGAGHKYGVMLDGQKGNVLTGGSASGGRFEDGGCKKASVKQSSLSLKGEVARVEDKGTLVDFPGAKLSDCDTGAAQKAAESAPCSSLVILEGERVEGLSK